MQLHLAPALFVFLLLSWTQWLSMERWLSDISALLYELYDV